MYESFETLLEAVVMREILLVSLISRNALASGSVLGFGFVDFVS